MTPAHAHVGRPPTLVPVSDAPRSPGPEDGPSPEELEHIAVPASLRLAPRFRRLIGTGAGGGFALGFLIGLVLPNSTGAGRATIGLFVGLGFALIGATIAGLLAVWLDRGTPRRLAAMKASEASRGTGPDPEGFSHPIADASTSAASAPRPSAASPSDPADASSPDPEEPR